MGFTPSTMRQRRCIAQSGNDQIFVLSSSVASTAATEEDKAAAGVPAATSEASTNIEDADIPTNLPSDCGMDYIPLATMLATGQLAEADQFTRDALITISGAKAKGRDFVYFTDVKNIPATDLATMERLWNKFSGGKFGYSVQKKKWKQSKGDFETFCRKIGWTTTDGEVERKKRWFGASEFIYDVKKAPEGHLPLTSALRGTSLIKNLLQHPVWDNDDWMIEPDK
ncbi:serine/threonine protein kinase [Nitzschia inconspicua]|uniref:Serine/threonine protein kinase n=1 Tax=Nitzschia inconspicua TaxID=303405 RepID=A0A9K3L7T6_9STRA|nr:serine/threonine protein kinase [Nitzschia inconspicua]